MKVRLLAIFAKTAGLILIGFVTGALYVTWSSAKSPIVVKGTVRRHALSPNTVDSFGHHHLLELNSPEIESPSTATDTHTFLERSEAVLNSVSNCEVSSNFPQTQLVVVNKSHPVSSYQCTQLFQGNATLQKRVRASLNLWHSAISDETFIDELTANCTATYNNFVNSFYISKIEKSFPLAFEMLVYYKPIRIQQYIRLLKNLYRPQNFYCIHIDKKSPAKWKQFVKTFSSCFPNIVVAKKQIRVEYARSSILYAHMECFQELLQMSHEWKYVISLHGTELPLMTNKEIVETLVNLNGSNAIQKGVNAANLKDESRKWLMYKVRSVYQGRWVELTNETLGPIPYNMSVYKSAASANSALSRDFVQFILNDKKAKAYKRFLKNVHSGVEFFFATMNALPEAPGGYHTVSNEDDLPLVSQRDWVNVIIRNPHICKERKVVHDICIVSSSDLPRLKKASEKKQWLFHNKYFMEYDHIVMDCIERQLLQRNYHEFIQDCEKATVVRQY